MTGHSLAGQGVRSISQATIWNLAWVPGGEGCLLAGCWGTTAIPGALRRGRRHLPAGLSKNSNITSTHGSLPFPHTWAISPQESWDWASHRLNLDVPQTTCLIRHRRCFRARAGLPSVHTIENSHSVIKMEWSRFSEWLESRWISHDLDWSDCKSRTFVSLFFFYILSYFLSKRMGCLSGCLVSSASVQKLFCEGWSASNDLLMNLWWRKWSPHPIPLPS